MSGRPKVPRIAEALLRWAATSDDERWIANDLEDEMLARAEGHGLRRAQWWYRWQVATSILPLVAQRLVSSLRSQRRGESMWQELRTDARYGLRLAARTPLTSAAVIITTVLGIGVTTAVFSVVDAVLIRPLPFAGSERTVQLFGVSNGDEIPSLAYPDLLDFRRTVPAIELLGIVRRAGDTYVGRTEARQLQLAETDSEFVRLLDLRPVVGRMFTGDEYAVGGPPTIVISHAFWMREFGGDPSVIGKTMQVGPNIRTIVGVLSNTRFMYPPGPLDAIMPLRIPDDDRAARGVMWLESLARLKPGVSVEQGRTSLATAARQIAIAFPEAAAKRSANAKLLRDAVIGSVSRMLILLTLAVAAVLLTGCINVGNLLLAQASTRTREFAVRSALGGSTWRVRRQVLTETLVLALLGGAIGIVVARPLTRALVGLYPGDLPRAAEVRMDLGVVLVAIASTVIAALLASIPSLRRAARQQLADGFRGGAGAGSSVKTRRLEGTLISAQMAATLALLFAATLLVKTFVSITGVNPGFDPRGTLSFLVTPSSAKHPGAAGVRQYYAELDRTLRAVPGVTAVTTMSHVPFQLGSQTDWFMRDDVGDRGKENPTTGVTIAAQGFERAVRLTILEGRSFTTADDSAAPRVVMINETLAKQAFPGVDPVGKTIHWSKEQWRIIGVVADAHDKSLIEPPPKMLYSHYPQRLSRTRWVIVRTNGAHGADVITPVRAALRALDPTVPLSYMATLDDRIADSVAAHRFRAWLVGSLGLLACALALIGIYAIVSQAVTRRTREIGIRIALGQDAASVQREVVVGAIRVAAAGSLVGVALSVAVGRSLSTFLYAVNGRDPLILTSAAVLLLACCGLASFFPARRASRVDPVVALRAE